LTARATVRHTPTTLDLLSRHTPVALGPSRGRRWSSS
jgi:hypothetical protein